MALREGLNAQPFEGLACVWPIADSILSVRPRAEPRADNRLLLIVGTSGKIVGAGR